MSDDLLIALLELHPRLCERLEAGQVDEVLRDAGYVPEGVSGVVDALIDVAARDVSLWLRRRGWIALPDGGLLLAARIEYALIAGTFGAEVEG